MNILSYEVNFDGLPGPTHYYGGLSLGNQASIHHGGEISNPKQAALQCLEKMHFISRLGIPQAILPPQERPHFPTLRALGFTGTYAAILENVQKNAPWLLGLVSSSAGMWTANAATVSPSIDCIDGHVHFTSANLNAMFHRSIEAVTTERILKAIFANNVFFSHHAPLPASSFFSDEGAANHTRFCKTYNGPGIEFFVYGKSAIGGGPSPLIYPARQTLEASEAIERLHGLFPGNAIFTQQNPQAIDAGVFHNDVISVGNQNVFLYHESAFLRRDVIKVLKKRVAEVCDTELNAIEVKNSDVPLEDAVRCYLFNSQLLTLPDGSMILIAPIESQRNIKISNYLSKLAERNDNPISGIHFVDLTQSMKNGGGPACLRLRVVLNENELAAANRGVFLTEGLYARLVEWVHKYYPETFAREYLSNPEIYEKNCLALNELTRILNLGKIYSFQESEQQP